MVSKPFAVKSLLILFVFAVLTLVLLVVSGHCTTTSRTNSLGILQYQGNPNSYVAGAVLNIAFAGEPRNYGVAVRVQPTGTYTLFTEEYFFCGDPSELFAGKRGPIVLVYETVVHHTVEGIGCHELRGVHELKEENF